MKGIWWLECGAIYNHIIDINPVNEQTWCSAHDKTTNFSCKPYYNQYWNNYDKMHQNCLYAFGIW